MSPFKEQNHDNVTYMLCMLIGMLLSGCFKSIIKWSNVWDVTFVKQKARASDNWYLFMLNVLIVFDFGI
jgi:hypothetical protein